MARFKRYRNYNRRSKGRWSSNIQEIGVYQAEPNPGIFADSIDLVAAPVQTPLNTSQTYTVKNIEASFVFEGHFSDVDVIEQLAVYIMYLPQGMAIGTDYNLQHPEYVMAYKFFGSPSLDNSSIAQTNSIGQQYQPIRIRTRLARKLNTGDKIILYYKGVNTATQSRSVSLQGLVRWWTKAN